MKLYCNKSEAVIDLHERGFTEDLQSIGTKLLWIQRKIFLTQKDFSILECHSFIDSFGKETAIFGDFKWLFASGILINHYKSNTDKTPAIIQSKLKKNGYRFIKYPGQIFGCSI